MSAPRGILDYVQPISGGGEYINSKNLAIGAVIVVIIALAYVYRVSAFTRELYNSGLMVSMGHGPTSQMQIKELGGRIAAWFITVDHHHGNEPIWYMKFDEKSFRGLLTHEKLAASLISQAGH